jgi:hypothetical protein
VRATRLTVPVSLASDLVPFIDCVQTTSAPNRLPVTMVEMQGTAALVV